jgi:hypothetical protein
MKSQARIANTVTPIATVLIALISGLLVFAQQPKQQRPRRVTTDEPQASANASPAAKTDEVDEGDVVRVETQLVSVPAVVTNSSGRPVTGLRADNFLLFENGQQQKITNFATTEAPFEIHQCPAGWRSSCYSRF